MLKTDRSPMTKFFKEIKSKDIIVGIVKFTEAPYSN